MGQGGGEGSPLGVLCSWKSCSLSWYHLHMQFPWDVKLFAISLAYSNNSSVSSWMSPPLRCAP